MRLVTLLLLLGLARAGDTLLAPTLEDLDAGLARLERLLAQAGDAEQRLADAHLAWIQEGCVASACPRGRAAALVVAARAAGHDERAWLQSARAELRRIQRAASFDAVRPLVDASRKRRLSTAEAEVGRASRAWSVRASFQERHVEPWAAAHAPLVAATCPEGE